MDHMDESEKRRGRSRYRCGTRTTGTATNGEQGRPPRGPTSSQGAHTLAHPFPPILHLSKTDICARQPARALACILFLIVCVACFDDTLAPRAESAPPAGFRLRRLVLTFQDTRPGEGNLLPPLQPPCEMFSISRTCSSLSTPPFMPILVPCRSAGF